MEQGLAVNPHSRCSLRHYGRRNNGSQFLQSKLERSWCISILRTMAWSQLGLGRMVNNLPLNLQHNNPHLPCRTNFSPNANKGLVIVKITNSLSRTANSLYYPRLFRL